jgi:hypothetical protein
MTAISKLSFELYAWLRRLPGFKGFVAVQV